MSILPFSRPGSGTERPVGKGPDTRGSPVGLQFFTPVFSEGVCDSSSRGARVPLFGRRGSSEGSGVPGEDSDLCLTGSSPTGPALLVVPLDGTFSSVYTSWKGLDHPYSRLQSGLGLTGRPHRPERRRVRGGHILCL